MGPGNAYVAEAKRQVFGTVGIDSIAGPSEVVVVADGNNDPRAIALDLLAQAEHDLMAQSILLTPDAAMAEKVERAVALELETLPRAEIARTSWDAHGAIITVRNLDEAADLVNEIAPEHLELMVDAPAPVFERVRHAGAIFVGRYCPEPLAITWAAPTTCCRPAARPVSRPAFRCSTSSSAPRSSRRRPSRYVKSAPPP